MRPAKTQGRQTGRFNKIPHALYQRDRRTRLTRKPRHCERSEAIQPIVQIRQPTGGLLDCHDAARLAVPQTRKTRPANTQGRQTDRFNKKPLRFLVTRQANTPYA